jgi:hypothetical protein
LDLVLDNRFEPGFFVTLESAREHFGNEQNVFFRNSIYCIVDDFILATLGIYARDAWYASDKKALFPVRIVAEISAHYADVCFIAGNGLDYLFARRADVRCSSKWDDKKQT